MVSRDGRFRPLVCLNHIKGIWGGRSMTAAAPGADVMQTDPSGTIPASMARERFQALSSLLGGNAVHSQTEAASKMIGHDLPDMAK